MLVTNAGRVLTHRQLLREVWGPAHGSSTRHYLRVYMARCARSSRTIPRSRKLLITETGVGYRLMTA